LQFDEVAQVGGKVGFGAGFFADDLLGGQGEEYAAVDALNDLAMEVEDAGFASDAFGGFGGAIDVEGEEALGTGIAHLMDEAVADADDFAWLEHPAGEGADAVFFDVKNGVFGSAEDLHGAVLGEAVIVEAGEVAGQPGHDHDLEVAFFIDELAAVAVGYGVLEVGPGQEVFLLHLCFEDKAAEFGGAKGAAVLQCVDDVGERRRTASDGDG